jgi:hypothetical protein
VYSVSVPPHILYPSWHCSLAHTTFSCVFIGITHFTVVTVISNQPACLVEPNHHEHFSPDYFIPALDSPFSFLK